MRAKQLLSDKLTQLVNELREEFVVEYEEKKTVFNCTVYYKDVLIASIHAKKTRANYDKALNILNSILLISDDVKKFFRLCDALNLTFEESQKSLRIKHEFDVPRLKNLIDYDFVQTCTKSLRRDATKLLSELSELAEVAEINYNSEDSESNCKIMMINVSELYETLILLQHIKDNYSEYIQSINTVVKHVSQHAKAANKLTTADNSAYLMHVKRVKQQELQALAEGDYDNVSDETLKNFVKETFYQLRHAKIKIIDKSSKFRAILVAELEYEYTRLLPAAFYLCGEDDNGETWIHSVVFDETYYYTEKGYSLSVQTAESILFDIAPVALRRFVARQGDVLILKDELYQYHDYTEEEIDCYEILPNHTLVFSSKTSVKVSMTANKIYLLFNVPAELQHPSHHSVRLEPGAYVFVTLPRLAD